MHELFKVTDVLPADPGTSPFHVRCLYYTRLLDHARSLPGGRDAFFAELKDVEEEKQPLDVEGRQIPYRKRAGGLVWFDFQALCGGPRSYADYVDLARRFHTVMLSGVPTMSPKNADAARRFTWLVDVFYDDRVKLVVSSEAQPEALFPDQVHDRRCLCVSCGTKRHPEACPCFWCGNRRDLDGEYRKAQERAERAPVPSDAAARHVARLRLTRRELAAELGVSVGTAQRVSTAGGSIPRRLERRVLEVRAR